MKRGSVPFRLLVGAATGLLVASLGLAGALAAGHYARASALLTRLHAIGCRAELPCPHNWPPMISRPLSNLLAHSVYVEAFPNDGTMHLAEIIAALTSSPYTVHLGLADLPLRSSDLQTVTSLNNVESLSLTRTDVGNAGMAALTRLDKLKCLSLRDCCIDDDACPYLARLQSLEHLSLVGTRVTDRGLAELTTLVNLELLDLRGTPIGDDGLKSLQKLPHLISLDVRGTRVTDRAARQMAMSVPQLHLQW